VDLKGGFYKWDTNAFTGFMPGFVHC
jgi:hypothetical protein